MFLAQAIIGTEAWHMVYDTDVSVDSPGLAVLFWCSRLLWIQVVWLANLSLVLLYRRLLAGLYMKTQLRAVIALVLVFWAIATLINVFPYRAFTAGDPFDRTHYTSWEMVHYWMTIYITGPLNITVSVVLAIMPFPLVKKLRLSHRDKTALMIIFSIGALKIIASALSWLMIILEPASNRYIFWKYIEEGAMIILQSLMVLRPLFHNVINTLSCRSPVDAKRSSMTGPIAPTSEDPDQARLRNERRHRRFGSRSIEQLELAEFVTDKRNLLTRSYIEPSSDAQNESKGEIETVISEFEMQIDNSLAGPQVSMDGTTDPHSTASPWSAIQVQNTFEQSFDNRSRSDILQFSKSEISTGGTLADPPRVPSKTRHPAGHSRLKSKISMSNLKLMEPDPTP